MRWSRKKSRRGWAWLLALGLVAAVSGAYGIYRGFFAGGSEAVEITATATRGVLPIQVTERGELESSKTVDVRCEVEGYQNKIATIVPEGTRLKKDQVVVTFDTDQLKRNHDDQEVKWKQAEGKMKAAKGELEVQRNKAETDVDKASTDSKLAELEKQKYIEGDYKVELEKTNSEIELAKKDLQDAKEKLEQVRKLVKRGIQTPEQLKVNELDYVGKKYTLSNKEAALYVLKQFTKVQKETEFTAKARDAKRNLERAKKTGEAAVDKAQSELEAAVVATRLEKQSLDRLKKQLAACVVKAPQDGILVYSKERYWDEGSRVQPGGMMHFQQTLFSLPDLARMQVKVKIHEAMVKKIKAGQKAELRVDAYPDAVLHGTVQSVATLADSRGPWDERGVKEYVTMVTIDDLPTDAGLKPGMTAEVKILAKELPDVLLVPVQSVAQQEGQHVCYVVTTGGIERREVTVGENNEKFVEIKSGLAEGEKVTLDARIRAAAETKAKETQVPDAPKQPVTESAPVQAPPQPAPR
jgi:RND family efflux transporter MFP subunit